MIKQTIKTNKLYWKIQFAIFTHKNLEMNEIKNLILNDRNDIITKL